MASQTPTLDLFVAAIHELREAVADSKYDVTTARERLALTKGVNFDSQLVEKVRGIITDIDKELHTTSDSLSNASTEGEKRMFMLQTMDYVEGKAFGKGESNESPPSDKDLTASILSDKESETKMGGSSTSQGKESELPIEGSATDQGRNDEIGLPPAETEVQGEENDYNELFVTQETKDLTQEAIDADLGPISDKDSGITFRIGEPEPTGPHPPLYVSHADAIMSIRKMHALLKLAIRPEIATPYQLDLFCRYVGDPVLFTKMREIIGELKWNP